jgi:hypothetical protein
MIQRRLRMDWKGRDSIVQPNQVDRVAMSTGHYKPRPQTSRLGGLAKIAALLSCAGRFACHLRHRVDLFVVGPPLALISRPSLGFNSSRFVLLLFAVPSLRRAEDRIRLCPSPC